MKRGELWIGAGGPDYANKPRPMIIVQSDDYQETDSVLVCLVTSMYEFFVSFRPALEPSAENGLELPSRAMVDKVSSVPRAGLRKRIGVLEPAVLEQIDIAMAGLLGLGR